MDPVGYAWLADRFDAWPVQLLPSRSAIGTARSTRQDASGTLEVFPPAMRPANTLQGHLTFALKHEGVNLELLARLFASFDSRELERWIRDEPTGQYARRSGFLYEWLTGKDLLLMATVGGNYVDALDESRGVVSGLPVKHPRWRVRDNLPGSRDFCPTVRWTPRTRAAAAYDCAGQLEKMQAEFGDDTLLRSAVWLTLKESKSSFAIEREGDETDRIRRFAHVMGARCGQGDSPLTEKSLEELQRAILGPNLLSSTGLRSGPVFVGESGPYGEVVHYVGPHWDALEGMLAGLQAFDVSTSNFASPVIRAAVVSFGFVFIHPLSDGNGRTSRFLVNDTLRRDGAVPAPFILPISVKMQETRMHPLNYDQALERYSRPFMARYSDAYHFGETIKPENGPEYNFHFDAYSKAQPTWAYPDLTVQTEYLAQVIQETIEQEMRQEASLMRDWRATRESIKNVVEGPDEIIDRIMRGVLGNGSISGKLIAQFPRLADPDIARSIERVVQDSGLPGSEALRLSDARSSRPPRG